MKPRTCAIYLGVVASGLLLGYLAKNIVHAFHSRPVLRVEPAVFELGEVGTGQVYTGTFSIENKGRQPLSLQVLKVSCTCTVAEMCESPLGPGQRASIKLHVRAPESEKEFGSYLSLKTNDPDQTQVDLQIRGRAVSVLNIMPQTLLFGELSTRELPVTKQLTVRPGTLAKPGMLQDLRVSSEGKDFVLNVAKSEEEMIISVTIGPGVPIGALRDNLNLALGSPAEYALEVPILAGIKGDYEISPASFVFGRVNVGTSTMRQCSITPVSPTAVIEILPENHPDRWSEALKLDIERGENEAIIKATFTPTSQEGVFERNVGIKLTDAKDSQPQYFQVPVLAVVHSTGSRQAIAGKQPVSRTQ